MCSLRLHSALLHSQNEFPLEQWARYCFPIKSIYKHKSQRAPRSVDSLNCTKRQTCLNIGGEKIATAGFFSFQVFNHPFLGVKILSPAQLNCQCTPCTCFHRSSSVSQSDSKAFRADGSQQGSIQVGDLQFAVASFPCSAFMQPTTFEAASEP